MKNWYLSINHAKHCGRLFLTSTLESKRNRKSEEIWPFSHGSSLLGFFFISSLSVSLFTVSNTVSVISCCHRSDTVKVKFSYNCWSASSNCKTKELRFCHILHINKKSQSYNNYCMNKVHFLTAPLKKIQRTRLKSIQSFPSPRLVALYIIFSIRQSITGYFTLFIMLLPQRTSLTQGNI